MPPKPTSKSPAAAPTGAKKHQNQQKAAQKPPKPLAEQLKRHFNSLCAQIDGGYFKNAIKTCNKILRLDPHDKEALATKLFLLIQTDQYESALKHVEEDQGSASARLFEKAYLLYRLQKESEASALLREMEGDGESSRASMHLEAQIKYRQAGYEGAREIYNSLLDSCPEDTEEHADLVTNLNATQAHLDFFQSGYAAALNTLEISVAALEEAGAPHIPGPSLASTSAIPALPAAAAAITTQQKAPRKARIPKHVIPGLTPMPDPERWLKKRERTSHRMEVGHGRGGRNKGKKGKEGMGAGSTQGMVLPPEKDGSGPPVRASTPSGGASTVKRGKKGR